MQWTPVAIANVLLQRLDPMVARSLALFGALALLLVAGGLLGRCLPWGRRNLGSNVSGLSARVPRLRDLAEAQEPGAPRGLSGALWPGLALAGVAGLTLTFAREASPLPALAYGAGQVSFLLPLLPELIRRRWVDRATPGTFPGKTCFRRPGPPGARPDYALPRVCPASRHAPGPVAPQPLGGRRGGRHPGRGRDRRRAARPPPRPRRRGAVPVPGSAGPRRGLPCRRAVAGSDAGGPIATS